MTQRKLHKSVPRYLIGQPRQKVETALQLLEGRRKRGIPEYHTGKMVMPWEIEALTPHSGLGDLQCYPVTVGGVESHQTASWIIGAMAATFSGCWVDLELCGEHIDPCTVLDYLVATPPKENDGGLVKVAVCGGVWFQVAPFSHSKQNIPRLAREFTDGFTHVLGVAAEALLI